VDVAEGTESVQDYARHSSLRWLILL